MSTSLAIEAYSRNLDINWQETKVIKTVIPGMQPTITESIEIIKRKVPEKLVNDQVAQELPQAWKYALREEMRVKEVRQGRQKGR